MKDDEYDAMRIRASICPGLETRWPPAETSHGIALHKCANEMRDHVSKTLAAIDAVERDKSLSPEGKRTKKHEIARQALSELERGTSFQKARESVAAQMQKWADKISANIKPAADQSEAVLHAQIREKVSNLKEGRMAFLQKHGTDPAVASALLEAPPFLSNLSEPELALLRIEVEKKYLSPEIIEAKTKVGKALLEAERGLRAAQAMIMKSAPPAIAAAPARVA